jgi:hypothetical protein
VSDSDRDQLDLAYRILDLDLVDSEGRRCGKVDDLVLSGGPGEISYVEGIRTGTGALAARSPRFVRGLLRRIFGQRASTIPSSEVDYFDAAICLLKTAAELDLATGDRRVASLFGGEEP